MVATPQSLRLNGIQFFTETEATLLAAATFTGTTRDVGGSVGGFAVRVFADQVGTLLIQNAIRGGTMRTVESIAIVASTMVERVFAPTVGEYRVFYTNGGVNQALFELATALLPPGA